jgi:hypothetical protein
MDDKLSNEIVDYLIWAPVFGILTLIMDVVLSVDSTYASWVSRRYDQVFEVTLWLLGQFCFVTTAYVIKLIYGI